MSVIKNGGLMHRVEVLSFAYEHLYLADWKDAISDVFIGRAEIVEEYDDMRIGVVGGSIPLPKIVRFTCGMTASKFRNKMKQQRFNKEALFMRDTGSCQYCLKQLTRAECTIDHVMPRSRGGATDWENCVICCEKCNRKKGNKTPSEAGMNLINLPARPKVSAAFRKKR